jgi:hypothetical protein
MMRTLLFTLICLACSVALAATVYRWVDENGTVHYSDQPHANAEKMSVQSAQTYPATATPSQAAAQANARAAQPAAPAGDAGDSGSNYQGCAIVDPQDGTDLSNVEQLNVSVRTDPVLRQGDKIFILMDGAAVNGGKSTGSQFSISPVDRGEHVLQAVVRDSSGNLMCQSSGITVVVHQNSILNPANPQNRNPAVRPH